jgi:threonine dehydratase
MPEWASLSKQEATRGYGATVVISGNNLDESASTAKSICRDTMAFIHPFDDEDVIAGQGTIGLEILDDLPDTDVIIVPVGGGGLISGISVAVRSQRAECHIIGVQSDACPSAAEAMATGGPVHVRSERTIADGIRVEMCGSYTFPVIRDLVETILSVSDDEISEAMLLLLERKKIMSEGAGAAPLAALLSGKVPYHPGDRIVLVISGGNVDSHQFSRIIRHSLVLQERLLRLSVTLDDRPGSLARLLCIIGGEGGNILQIYHNPDSPGNSIQTVQVEIEMETRGSDHSRSIRRRIESEGISVRG